MQPPIAQKAKYDQTETELERQLETNLLRQKDITQNSEAAINSFAKLN